MVFAQDSTLIGDVDCSGEVNSQDASLILQFVTNVIDELPCEANMTGLTPDQLQEMIDMMSGQLNVEYTGSFPIEGWIDHDYQATFCCSGWCWGTEWGGGCPDNPIVNTATSSGIVYFTQHSACDEAEIHINGNLISEIDEYYGNETFTFPVKKGDEFIIYNTCSPTMEEADNALIPASVNAHFYFFSFGDENGQSSNSTSNGLEGFSNFGDFILVDTSIETEAQSDGFLYGQYYLGGPSDSWIKVYCDTFSGNTNIRGYYENNPYGGNFDVQNTFLIPINQGEFYSFDSGGSGPPSINETYFIPLVGSTSNNMSESNFAAPNSSNFAQNIFNSDFVFEQHNLADDESFSYVIPEGKNLYLDDISENNVAIDFYNDGNENELYSFTGGGQTQDIIFNSGDSLVFYIQSGSFGFFQFYGYLVDADPSVEVVFINLNTNYVVPDGKKLITEKVIYDHCTDMIFNLPNGNSYPMNNIFHDYFAYLPSGSEIIINFNDNVSPPEFPYYYISGYLIDD